MRSSSNFRSESRPSDYCKEEDKRCNYSGSRGQITVIGLGPGDPSYLSFKAKEKILEAQVIVGYSTYIKLIDPSLLKGKKVITTGMRAEIERCKKALEIAKQGKKVVLVSSGDPGIYGMAGPMLEIIAEKQLDINVEIIPGIPAFCAASAIVGAPIMHDFASISLSDILTPWETIKKRLNLAIEGDFIIIIYNPRSKHRTWQLQEVKKIFIEKGKGSLPVAIVKNANREGQKVRLTLVKDINIEEVDMKTILIIGNSSSKIVSNWFITPRGYKEL